MREILSRSLNSSDLETQEYESSIDRIGALRGSSRLGSALHRWRNGMDKSSYGKAYVLALKLASRELRIAPRHPAFVTLRLAVKQAMIEWAYPNCRDCNGIGMIKASRQQVQGETTVDHVCQTVKVLEVGQMHKRGDVVERGREKRACEGAGRTA